VQHELNIEEQTSFVITIKNPQKSSPPYAGLPKRQKTEYPKDLQTHISGIGDSPKPIRRNFSTIKELSLSSSPLQKT
jgi:hypothetical protein